VLFVAILSITYVPHVAVFYEAQAAFVDNDVLFAQKYLNLMFPNSKETEPLNEAFDAFYVSNMNPFFTSG
jgi:hypothetical protein